MKNIIKLFMLLLTGIKMICIGLFKIGKYGISRYQRFRNNKVLPFSEYYQVSSIATPAEYDKTMELLRLETLEKYARKRRLHSSVFKLAPLVKWKEKDIIKGTIYGSNMINHDTFISEGRKMFSADCIKCGSHNYLSVQTLNWYTEYDAIGCVDCFRSGDQLDDFKEMLKRTKVIMEEG